MAAWEEQPDEALVGACLSGDQSAWDALVDRYAALVHSIPRQLGLPEQSCDDVFQTVFAILVRRLGTLRDRQSLAKWLIVTTKRESWRQARLARRTVTTEQGVDPGADDPPVDRLQRVERIGLVRSGLSRLGSRCRELLLALFGQDKPDYTLISRTLEIPVGSIGPTRARCLKKLQDILEADPEARAAFEDLERD